MSRRLTTDDVHIELSHLNADGQRRIEAHVRGLRATYVVDLNPAWSDGWLCSCGRAINGTECAHIRVTREVVKL